MIPTGRRSPWLLAALLPILALVAACGGTASAPLDNVGAPIPNEGGQAAATAAPATAIPATDGSGSGSGSTDGNNGAVVPRSDLQIVYTGSLEMMVSDVSTAVAKGRTAVLATGGYIGASSETNDGDKHLATITYRIPASRWEDTLTALRGVGDKVINEETQATEVGGQIVDLEARIRNLRASEEVLVGIAKSTGKVSDLLEVQSRLSDVRGQIEELDGQRAQLTDQVAYGTLVTTYGTEIVAVVEQAKGWDPATEVDGATATLIAAGQTIASAAIWFGIVWLPMLLLVLLIALIVRAAFRRFMPAPQTVGPVPGWGEGS
ncbi:MAG: DUF4349 domain-containing protein [Chloroflexota bacterium]